MDDQGFVWQRDAGPVLSQLSSAAAVCVAVSQALTYAQLCMYDAEHKERTTKYEAENKERMMKSEAEQKERLTKSEAEQKKRLTNLEYKVDRGFDLLGSKIDRLAQQLEDQKKKKRWWR